MQKPNNSLPDFILADLYKNNLVIVNEDIKLAKNKTYVEEKSIEVKPSFLGGNLQKISILVTENEAVYLNEASLQFLSSILGACKLNLGDVAVINYLNHPVSYAHVKENLSPRIILLFGVSAKAFQVPFSVPLYQVQQHDNCTFLWAPPLENILGETQEARLEKSKLWLCLKKIFAV